MANNSLTCHTTNEKCCYDCVFCIPSNAPLEVSVQYECFLQKCNSIDAWSKPCENFVEDKRDGK